MVYRLRCSDILVKLPCGACLSRAGIERQGQGAESRLYGYFAYSKNKEVERE